MTPRGGGADEFRAPRPGGLTVEQAAAKITAEFGAALSALASEATAAYGIPPGLRPLAWFRTGDDVPRCGPCSTEIEVSPTLLRCPDCGAVASKPEWWSP